MCIFIYYIDLLNKYLNEGYNKADNAYNVEPPNKPHLNFVWAAFQVPSMIHVVIILATTYIVDINKTTL